MKLIVNKKKESKKKENVWEWNKWFAWFPVRALGSEEDCILWWCYVERIAKQQFITKYNHSYSFLYREIK